MAMAAKAKTVFLKIEFFMVVVVLGWTKSTIFMIIACAMHEKSFFCIFAGIIKYGK